MLRNTFREEGEQAAMSAEQAVEIRYFRHAGRWRFLKVRRRSAACEAAFAVLQRLMQEAFQGKPVSLVTLPWLDHWRMLARLGARRAPVILINGSVFSHGVAPDPAKLVEAVAGILGDESLKREAARFGGEALRPAGAEGAAAAPQVERNALSLAVELARRLLAANGRDGWTRAALPGCPYQRSWDAAFIARACLHYDPERAYNEVFALFQGQWTDGFLPHVVFDPGRLDLFPGPEYWQAERSGRVPSGVFCSGITHPPVHASMLVAANELDPDGKRARKFLGRTYPRIKTYHNCLHENRDPQGEGLVAVMHPWESGVENTVLWEEPLAGVGEPGGWAREMHREYEEHVREGERPARPHLPQHAALVESFLQCHYDWKALSRGHGFVVQDVFFNSILCRAEADLGGIARAIGEGDPQPHFDRAARMARAINEKLWDEEQGLYFSCDLVAGRLIRRATAFSYMPLYAGICDDARAARLIDHLKKNVFPVAGGPCVAVPVWTVRAPARGGEFCWRGTIWFSLNWFLAKGLRAYGEEALADSIEESLLLLAVDHGFHEHYEPETGRGLGAPGFSATAALFVDLAAGRVGA